MTPLVPQQLFDEWLAIRRTGARDAAKAALEFYFSQILPLVIGELATRSEHADLRARGCSILVSTMGMSPETTVIAAEVLRPKRLVIVSSQDADHGLDLAYAFLDSHGILKPRAIRVEDVDPTNPEDIYSKIRRHFPSGGSDGTPVMDVTGGKKIMSATAAVAAWELRIPLCYVEGEYDRVLRQPRPGTERVILLRNPSQVQARLLRERAMQWYEGGNMGPAIEAFRESRDAQTTQPQLDELALELAGCHEALLALDFDRLGQQVAVLTRVAGRPNVQHLTARLPLDRHLAALERVLQQDRFALLATFRHLASRYARQGRADFACLLLYRTMEELVRHGLAACSRTHDFDLSAPDLTLLVEDVGDLTTRYAAAWAPIREGETTIPARITLLAGLTLLGLVTDLPRHLGRDLSQLLRHAAGLAAMRNHSILAHGTRNLRKADVERLADLQAELARAILGAEAAEVDRLELDLEPPDLRALV